MKDKKKYFDESDNSKKNKTNSMTEPPSLMKKEKIIALEIKSQTLLEEWILKKGVFSFFENDFDFYIILEKNREENFSKIIIKLINKTEISFEDISINDKTSKGLLLFYFYYFLRGFSDI